jgi:hypothetical protein
MARILLRAVPVWSLPDPSDAGLPRQVCIDCPACGNHVLVDEGQQWCFMCRWELERVEQHVGPPAETGFKVGDVVMTRTLSMGTVRYIDPSGFVELLSEGWTMRFDPHELRHVQPHTSWLGDLLLGLEPLEPGEYPPFQELFRAFESDEL